MAADTGKVALITGANKGLGFETARELGRRGCTVFVCAREAASGERAAAQLRDEGVDARFLELDLSRPETITNAAGSVGEQFDRLDILINNAGISLSRFGDGAPEVADPDVVSRLLEVNFLGALRVTQAFLPSLRKSAAGRIVNVSTGLGSLQQNGDPAFEHARFKLIGYAASKAALNMLTVQLAYTLKDTPIKVNASDPGFTATDFNQHRGQQTVQEGVVSTVRLATLPEDGPTGGFFDARGPVPW